MVLLAGILMSENLRIRRSRILRAPPAGVLTLHVQDKVLHLKGKLVGIPIGTAAPVRQPLNAAFLIAVEDFVPCFTGDSELPAKFCHPLAGEPASHKLQSFVHYRTLLPRHHSLPKKGRKCNLCVRYDLLPMCRVAHKRTEYGNAKVNKSAD